jgi:hypothetical protein
MGRRGLRVGDLARAICHDRSALADSTRHSGRWLSSVERRALLSNVRKVTHMPAGGKVRIISGDFAGPADSKATPVRVVADPRAPVVRALDADQTHPFRQTELLVASTVRRNRSPGGLGSCPRGSAPKAAETFACNAMVGSCLTHSSHGFHSRSRSIAGTTTVAFARPTAAMDARSWLRSAMEARARPNGISGLTRSHG